MNNFFSKLVLRLLAGLVSPSLAYAEVLVSPPMNSQVYSGQPTLITVDSTLGDATLEVRLAMTTGYGLFSPVLDKVVKTGTKPLMIEVPIPGNITGPVKFVMYVRGVESGTWEEHTHVVFVVPDPADPLIKLNVSNNDLFFDTEDLSTQPRPHQQILVSGKFSSGVRHNLAQGLTGTTYQSSDESIVTVDADGQVTPTGPGHAVLTVKHGEHQAYATVHVDDPTTGQAPVTDVSAAVAVARGGFRKDPATGEYTQQLTLTNTSSQPIPGPLLYVVLSNLDPDIKLRTMDGATRHIQPLGSWYYGVELDAQKVLAPGEQIYFTARFRNPQNIPITYDYRVFVGGNL
jgi:hypothetical protein